MKAQPFRLTDTVASILVAGVLAWPISQSIVHHSFPRQSGPVLQPPLAGLKFVPPKGVPTYPGARTETAGVGQSGFAGTYQTDDPPALVLSYYTSHLEPSLWAITSQDRTHLWFQYRPRPCLRGSLRAFQYEAIRGQKTLVKINIQEIPLPQGFPADFPIFMPVANVTAEVSGPPERLTYHLGWELSTRDPDSEADEYADALPGAGWDANLRRRPEIFGTDVICRRIADPAYGCRLRLTVSLDRTFAFHHRADLLLGPGIPDSLSQQQ